MRQFETKPTLLFVRFEQGRGHTGVPKTIVPYWVGNGVGGPAELLARETK